MVAMVGAQFAVFIARYNSGCMYLGHHRPYSPAEMKWEESYLISFNQHIFMLKKLFDIGVFCRAEFLSKVCVFSRMGQKYDLFQILTSAS